MTPRKTPLKPKAAPAATSKRIKSSGDNKAINYSKVVVYIESGTYTAVNLADQFKSYMQDLSYDSDVSRFVFESSKISSDEFNQEFAK